MGLLNPGGAFISLHEPTPMASVVESAKIIAYPIAVVAPGFFNSLARVMFSGNPSSTDLWMFEAYKLKRVALSSGFQSTKIQFWGLFRPMIVQWNGLHLTAKKPTLTEVESRRIVKAVWIDSILNIVFPGRCFGSISLFF